MVCKWQPILLPCNNFSVIITVHIFFLFHQNNCIYLAINNSLHNHWGFEEERMNPTKKRIRHLLSYTFFSPVDLINGILCYSAVYTKQEKNLTNPRSNFHMLPMWFNAYFDQLFLLELEQSHYLWEPTNL